MVFKVWRTWPNSKLICYSERGERRLSFGYKFVGLSWKPLKLYTNVHSYFFFSSYSIVLFPLRTPASWRSAKCTRRVLKVWSHWPNSKLICYPERGTRRLSFGYRFVDLPWKLLKIYPTVHSYLLFYCYTVLYCFHWEHRQVEGVLSAHGGVLKVWRNWPNSQLICYSERGEPRLSFGYKFVGLPWKLLKLYRNVTFILCIFFFIQYCIVSTENIDKLK